MYFCIDKSLIYNEARTIFSVFAHAGQHVVLSRKLLLLLLLLLKQRMHNRRFSSISWLEESPSNL